VKALEKNRQDLAEHQAKMKVEKQFERWKRFYEIALTGSSRSTSMEDDGCLQNSQLANRVRAAAKVARMAVEREDQEREKRGLGEPKESE
jgi:hypothetical protein